MIGRICGAALMSMVIVSMTGCPVEPYSMQTGTWIITFPDTNVTYGLHFLGLEANYIALPVDLGFGKLAGQFRWELHGNNIVIERLIDANTTYIWEGVLTSSYTMNGEWHLEGGPNAGQWSAIHSDPNYPEP